MTFGRTGWGEESPALILMWNPRCFIPEVLRDRRDRRGRHEGLVVINAIVNHSGWLGVDPALIPMCTPDVLFPKCFGTGGAGGTKKHAGLMRGGRNMSLNAKHAHASVGQAAGSVLVWFIFF